MAAEDLADLENRDYDHRNCPELDIVPDDTEIVSDARRVLSVPGFPVSRISNRVTSDGESVVKLFGN